MKCPDRETVSELESLPNIGKAMAADLRLLKIFHPRELIGKDAYRLYDELCSVTGKRHDPCVIDVFLSVVGFMEGGEAVPWWEYSAERKRYLAAHSSSKSTSSIPISSS